jgi:hypothetical protein
METHSSPKTVFCSLICHFSFHVSAFGRCRPAVRGLRVLSGVAMVFGVFQGTNCLAAATPSPSSSSWGAVAVGNTSAPHLVTLTNGTTAITISKLTFTGTNAQDFQVYTNTTTCVPSLQLQPAQSCAANILFKPTASGTRTATLNFFDSATGSPQTVALTGTGTGGTSGTVSISPSPLQFGSVNVGASSTLTATLKNGSSTAITINPPTITGMTADFSNTSNCPSSLGATLSCTINVTFKPTTTGLRTATLTVSGSSPQTVSLSGTGGSTGSNPGAFQIIPKNPVVYENNSLDFAATVNVTWSASCGSIGPTTGTYTAPGSTGNCTVTATDGSNTKVMTTVTVLAGSSSGTLALYPTSAVVYAGNTQVFQAQLSGIPDSHSLTYSKTGGAITNQGVYTAPSTAGSYSVTVKDLSLNTTASAAVTVFSKVAVDFASRSTSLHKVPDHLFGAERMDSMHNTGDLDLVKAGGINYARFYALIPQVFATKTPNWGPLDSNVARISAGGTKIILQVHQTPPWLLPSSSPCSSTPNNAMPTDVNAWGQMAAQYVNHLEDKYPGVVTDYEIWNEPNTQALCVPTADKLSSYMKLYSAAAPLMIAAIKAHPGSTARVGGPATAGFQSSWVNAMLADPVISQNIQFMAYHDYMFGGPQVQAQWDTYNGTITTSGCPSPCGISVYQRTQNTGAGPMATYVYAASRVAAGKQPQGKNLPIYNTEYNLNWFWGKNCCQNDPVYAPVWNGMYVADVLNAVYNGAPNVIGHMVYFAANASGTKSNTNSNFCLIGNWDTNMDCPYPNPSSPQAYPQYFLYQLLGATKYLGLQNGGYMASSISPSTRGNGLVVTAFYTANLDAIVLINPTADPLNGVPVTANNTGIAGASGTLYRIVNGQSIQSSAVSLQLQGGTSYSTTVDIPPYSVQAIAISH